MISLLAALGVPAEDQDTGILPGSQFPQLWVGQGSQGQGLGLSSGASLGWDCHALLVPSPAPAPPGLPAGPWPASDALG